jgi:hypothetical protein
MKEITEDFKIKVKTWDMEDVAISHLDAWAKRYNRSDYSISDLEEDLVLNHDNDAVVERFTNHYKITKLSNDEYDYFISAFISAVIKNFNIVPKRRK